MRMKLMVSGLVGLLALTPAVLAQLPPPAANSLSSAALEVATVIVPEVEVRCGGSAQYYATSKLKQGDTVQVVRESPEFPGWLAIKPPRESYSLINGKAIFEGKTQNLAVVFVDEGVEVPVLAGSTVSNQSPNATVAKVKRGTILTILGQANVTDSGTWFPIAPTAAEVRYIPTTAVRRNTTAVVATHTTLPTPGGASDDERKTLQKLLQETNDPAAKQYLMVKLQQLPPTGATQPISHTVPGQTMSMPGNLGPAPGGTSLYNGQPPAGNAQWSTYGILRSTAIRDGQQPMYALLDARGLPITYVTTQPGMSLEGYVGRTVALYGVTTYRSTDYLRSNVLVATHVAAAQ